MVATDAEKITNIVVLLFIQPTGKLPTNTSRNVPPPIAVIKEIMRMPNGSSFFPWLQKHLILQKQMYPARQ